MTSWTKAIADMHASKRGAATFGPYLFDPLVYYAYQSKCSRHLVQMRGQLVKRWDGVRCFVATE